MMRGRSYIYKWLLAVWLICTGVAVSPVSAYQSSMTNRQLPMTNAQLPAYQFRSTSSMTPIVGRTVYTSDASFTPVGASAPKKTPRRGIDDEEDDPSGDPVGTIDTPVGDPLILLIMACLFLIWKIGYPCATLALLLHRK